MDGGDGWICVGVVAGAHGVRGELRVKPFTADPEAVAAYGPVSDETGSRRLELAVRGMQKGVVIVRAAGVEDRDAAEALRGLRLYVPRAALPAAAEGEFYHADLIGVAAELADGTTWGRVRAVYDFGAGDVVEIACTEGGSVVVPFTREAVPLVEPGRRIVVDPPAGLLEDAR